MFGAIFSQLGSALGATSHLLTYQRFYGSVERYYFSAGGEQMIGGRRPLYGE